MQLYILYLQIIYINCTFYRQIKQDSYINSLNIQYKKNQVSKAYMKINHDIQFINNEIKYIN